MPTELNTDFFIDNIVEEEKEKVKQEITPVVAKRMVKEATRIESAYFRVVADSMNFFSPPKNLLGDGDPFEGIKWKRLKRSTIARKRDYYSKHGGAGSNPRNKWFFTGSLQNFLKHARVGSYFKDREVTISDGVIEYKSNLENERKFFNEKQEVKITGTLKTGDINEEVRPIFEPIREFYLNVRLPRFLEKAADDAIAWELNRTPKWRNFK